MLLRRYYHGGSGTFQRSVQERSCRGWVLYCDFARPRFKSQTVSAAIDAFRAAASLPRRVTRRLPLIIAMSHLLPVVRIVLLSSGAGGSGVRMAQSEDLRCAGTEEACAYSKIL